MHKLLERQIKNTLGDINPASLTSGWQKFFAALNDTYVHTEEDRTLLTRSLEVSSKEHMELNKRLQEQMKDATARMEEMEKLNTTQEQIITDLRKELAELKK